MEQGAVGPVADAEWSCKIHSNEGTSHVAKEPWRGFHFGADRWVENIPGFFFCALGRADISAVHAF